MDVWIKSQDGMNLVNVKQICIDYSDNKQIIANYVPDFIGTEGSYYECLGKYKSKERAFEIFEEILGQIQSTIMENTQGWRQKPIESIMFKMPKE